LATQIEALSFVRLAAEINSDEELANKLQNSNINVVFFHMDTNPASTSEVIETVATRFPEIALIAVGHNTNPEAILAPMRAGCDQFVCAPIDQDDLAAALARAAAKRSLVSHSSRCICLTGSSGGIGTTALAANLALEIASLTERECALVDLDFQFGDLAINFDCMPKRTIYDLAAAQSEIDQSNLRNSLADVGSNVLLLARPETIHQQAHLTPDLIRQTLTALTGVYENVVVDIPRSIDEKTLAAFRAADTILVICQLLVPSIRNTTRLIDTLKSLEINPDRIEVVVNRADSHGGRVSQTDLEEAVSKPPYAIVPNDYVSIAQAIDFGQPLSAIHKKSPVRTAIHGLAAKLTGYSEDDETKTKKSGLIGRIFSK
jgi:pilus assembly protein CpaE